LILSQQRSNENWAELWAWSINLSENFFPSSFLLSHTGKFSLSSEWVERRRKKKKGENLFQHKVNRFPSFECACRSSVWKPISDMQKLHLWEFFSLVIIVLGSSFPRKKIFYLRCNFILLIFFCDVKKEQQKQRWRRKRTKGWEKIIQLCANTFWCFGITFYNKLISLSNGTARYWPTLELMNLFAFLAFWILMIAYWFHFSMSFFSWSSIKFVTLLILNWWQQFFTKRSFMGVFFLLADQCVWFWGISISNRKGCKERKNSKKCERK
jgi:hypothetical protein